MFPVSKLAIALMSPWGAPTFGGLVALGVALTGRRLLDFWFCALVLVWL
jgi:hypothetical protein